MTFLKRLITLNCKRYDSHMQTQKKGEQERVDEKYQRKAPN